MDNHVDKRTTKIKAANEAKTRFLFNVSHDIRTPMNVEHAYVICGKTKLREILLNIIGNSIKYTPNGGQITLDISEHPSERHGFATGMNEHIAKPIDVGILLHTLERFID